MDTIRAQSISDQKLIQYYWSRFQEWNRNSLLFYPMVFMIGSILLVWITREIDIYLMNNSSLSVWWMARSDIVVTITSSVNSSVLSLLAIGFSISLVAIQMANQTYSPRATSIVLRASSTKIALSIIIAAFVYSFLLMIEVLRSSRDEISIVSLLTTILLTFACLIAFIFFIKSVMLMIKVTYIITMIDESTQESVNENFPPEEEYITCQLLSFEQPQQVIYYSRLSDMPFTKRYENGVLKGLENSALIQMASKHRCVILVIPHFGDFINVGDPIVEVYGERNLDPEEVLKEIYIEPERGIYQDPAYGIRMLVDIALQALSPAVNAPTTAHQAILRLTNLLAMIAERPQHTGAFADEYQQIRLIYPQTTWDEFVELTFHEIFYYGKDDPQTKKSLAKAYDYLLERVPESCKQSIMDQKALLISTDV